MLRRTRALLILILPTFWALWVGPGSAFGQVSPDTTRVIAPVSEQEIAGLRMMELRALEGAVADSEYIVGPGDVFGIYIYGPEERAVEAVVSADGYILVPTLGPIRAAGKTLAQLKREVKARAADRYRKGGIALYLTQVRQFRVHVLGEVLSPDTYVASAVDRVGHLIDKAGGLGPWAAPEEIVIQHKDGTKDTVNYLAYRITGDLKHSPFVRDGDLIYVPQVDLSKPTVYVEGAVKNYGYHQLRPGETLREFIQRFSYNFRTLDLKEVLVVREREGKRWAMAVALRGSELSGDSCASNIPLEDGDRIVLSSKRRRVYVSGAVTRPGDYPYFPGYTAVDYAGMAGPTPDAADLKGVKVYRATSGEWQKGPDVLVRQGDTVFVPEAKRRRWMDYLSITSGIASIIVAAVAVGLI